MRAKLRHAWGRLRASFWFLPAGMAAAAVALAMAAVAADRSPLVAPWLWRQGWIYAGGAEGARAVLEAVAGSMITIAGVVFSITLVALTLASSQFGPRLLRNFMRDTANQAVLGTFVATFLYCLLVLRTIRRDDESAFVPHLSVTLGVALAVLSLGMLIYFIHHVAVSIQADELAARVAADLSAAIDRLFPAELGRSPGPARPAEAPAGPGRPVRSAGDGYVTAVDADGLLELARRADAVIRLERRPGDYVIAGAVLAVVWAAGPAAELDGGVNEAFVLGDQRTTEQDAVHAVNQLVEMAVRALSPGVNDPFTAVVCIDRLGSALARLAGRPRPSPHRLDEAGRLRVIAPAVTFAEVADAALGPIRQQARGSALATGRLLEAVAAVAERADQPGDRAALRRHADLIARNQEALCEEDDRAAVQRRYQQACRLLRERDDAGRGPEGA